MCILSFWLVSFISDSALKKNNHYEIVIYNIRIFLNHRLAETTNAVRKKGQNIINIRTENGAVFKGKILGEKLNTGISCKNHLKKL